MDFRHGYETLVIYSFNLSIHIVEKWLNIIHDGVKLLRKLNIARRNASSPLLLTLSRLGIFKIKNSKQQKVLTILKYVLVT